MPNPFYYGGRVNPEQFIGRRAELQRIFAGLEVAHTGQMQSFSIVGPRRIGKSSLLFFVANRTTATLADADHALDSVLTTGVAYFQDLWGSPSDSDDDQRAVMRAVATGQDVRVFHETPQRAAPLRKLAHRDILMQSDGGYAFRVELVRRWVERNVA